MNPFPALIIGGPPHAGKSVLTASLTQALRDRGVAHLVLRAAPDGEGDWSNELPANVVTLVRRKGQWTRAWVDAVCRTVANRHLPLVVDVGGSPTPEQEAIFDQCTHAALLTKDCDTRREWMQRVNAHDLTLIADLHSSREGSVERQPNAGAGVLVGALNGLERQGRVRGATFDALVERVGALFRYSEADMTRRHLALAPWARGGEPVHLVNFDAWQRTHPPRFTEQDIARGIASIPADTPLALYGRAPNDLVARVAYGGNVAWVFSAREGWLRPPRLTANRAGRRGQVHFHLDPGESGGLVLHATKNVDHLDYDCAGDLVLPPAPSHVRVLIDGSLPQWLVAGIAHAYAGCAGVTCAHARE